MFETANNFNLREGATVITNTASSGQAGDIRLNVKDNLNLIRSNEEARANQIKQPAKPTEEIVEAKAWFVGANGNVILTANPSQTNTFRNPWIVPYFCNQ